MSQTESTAPYGAGPESQPRTTKRVRIHHLQPTKDARRALADAHRLRPVHRRRSSTQAGIPVLLVGDSAANNVFGYETTLPVTVDELLPLVRAVVRSARARARRRRPAVRQLPGGPGAGAATPPSGS